MSRTTDPRVQPVTTTAGSTALTAVAGTFNAGDSTRPIAGAGIPVGTILAAVTSSTAAMLSIAATASGTVPATIGLPGQVVQDAQRYGFQGTTAQSDAEAGSYTVAASIAGVIPPDRITDTTTGVTSKQRALP